MRTCPLHQVRHCLYKAADHESLTDILDLEQRAVIQVGEGNLATDPGCGGIFRQISPLFWGSRQENLAVGHCIIQMKVLCSSRQSFFQSYVIVCKSPSRRRLAPEVYNEGNKWPARLWTMFWDFLPFSCFLYSLLQVMRTLEDL